MMALRDVKEESQEDERAQQGEPGKEKVCGWMGEIDGEDVKLVNCELMMELRKIKGKMCQKPRSFLAFNGPSLKPSTISLPLLFKAF